ncbi:MAG: class I SAM-dependent methyltransferase [Pseudomonadota bacterium]
MFIEASELWDFYDRPLGHMTRRLLGTRLRSRWRHIEGETLMGLGYAAPLMGSFRGEARRIGALMPASQGALVWPANGDSMTTLVDPEHLPLPDNSVDRLLAVHYIEHVDRAAPVLREIWRVLAPEGSAMFIVPNRGGLWARFESTPFGHGRPYSRGQLERLLMSAMMTPTHCTWALHLPPINRQLFVKSGVVFERMGARILPGVAGVMMLEATKSVAQATPKGTPASVLGDLVRLPAVRPAIRPASYGQRLERTNVRASLPLEQEHGFLAEQVLEPDRSIDREPLAGTIKRNR